MSGGSSLIATSRSSVRSWARNTAPIPPLPSIRSILYLPSTRRWRRWSSAAALVVLVGPPPPDWSAPHTEQYRLFSGTGVWQLMHSTVPLVMGEGPAGGGVPERTAAAR